jgi:hypothetical protein
VLPQHGHDATWAIRINARDAALGGASSSRAGQVEHALVEQASPSARYTSGQGLAGARLPLSIFRKSGHRFSAEKCDQLKKLERVSDST